MFLVSVKEVNSEWILSELIMNSTKKKKKKWINYEYMMGKVLNWYCGFEFCELRIFCWGRSVLFKCGEKTICHCHWRWYGWNCSCACSLWCFISGIIMNNKVSWSFLVMPYSSCDTSLYTYIMLTWILSALS